ncbi:hypothetical protein EVAR_84723_1 [Eumeta japonica]|uniref:Uncharacterized protein n=1 Tax=Eumeta variegata TaxID=151549 RepID=A0A4C1VT53_EUMVA|nr:hypothetical protein EVAR_84723_1 [Eumeta japonica]
MLRALVDRKDDPDEGRSEKKDTGSLTHAWLSRAPPRQPPLRNPVPPPPPSACARRAPGWPGVGTGLKIETDRRKEGRRRWVIGKRRRGEGRGSLTRTALAAAVRRVDSLISGRQARSVRSTPTRVTDACRLDPVGVHQRPTTGGRLRVRPVPRLPPSDTTSSQPGAPTRR